MKKFSSSINGYDKTEVNEFVNEVTVEYENMLNNLKARDAEIASLKEKLEHYINIEKTLNRAIYVAEEASSQIKNIAKEEAKTVIENARKNASRIVNESLLKAQKINSESDALRRRIVIYKRRIRQVIEEQLDMVDDVDNIEF